MLLGGAALTRAYVEDDCWKAYGEGPVAYARDAFDGLMLMEKAVSGTFPAYVAERVAKASGAQQQEAAHAGLRQRCRGQPRAAAGRGRGDPAQAPRAQPRRRGAASRRSGARAPSSTSRSRRCCPTSTSRCSTNSTGATRSRAAGSPSSWTGRTRSCGRCWAHSSPRPRQEKIFAPQAAYGYFKAAGEGNAIVLFDEGGNRELARFELPRQAKEGGLCIADFLRDVDEPERDVLGLQVVTVGQRASEVAREWFAADRYQDYVRLHGLGVELAEALAEYVHGKIRAELGFGHQDARDMRELLKQGYRGSRYSFGYPACPNLADQARPAGAPGRGSHRHRAVRRGPALARAEHQRHRPPPPAGALLQRLRSVALPAWA